MSRWRPYHHKGSVRNYSISRKLKKDGKINSAFELMMNALTLEEVLALKMELSSKSLGGKIFGLPLWSAMTDICKDALLKYAFSAARTKAEAIQFIGLSPIRFSQAIVKYGTKSYFKDDEETS